MSSFRTGTGESETGNGDFPGSSCVGLVRYVGTWPRRYKVDDPRVKARRLYGKPWPERETVVSVMQLDEMRTHEPEAIVMQVGQDMHRFVFFWTCWMRMLGLLRLNCGRVWCTIVL